MYLPPKERVKDLVQWSSGWWLVASEGNVARLFTIRATAVRLAGEEILTALRMTQAPR